MESAREAKEFLVAQIALEAQRENVILTDVERKMLYFSESGLTLPDMPAVSDEFDSEYDQGKYEKKIAQLIRRGYAQACKDSGETYDKWWASIRVLDSGDHYILVMIRLAGLRPRHDQLKLLVTGLAVVALLLGGMFLSIKYDLHLPKFARRLNLHASLGEYMWAFAVCAFILYQSLRFIIGAKKTDDLTSKALRAFARVSNRVK
jgi:hypothetical protein